MARNRLHLVLGAASLLLAGAVHAADVGVRAAGGPVAPAARIAVGIAAVLAGLSLLALAVSLAADRGLRWWRLAAVPLLAIGLFWSMLPVALGIVATRGSSPADIDLGDGYVEAAVPAGDGASLALSYRPGSNGATVICLPGSGSTRRAIAPHAELLAKAGYGVVLVDPRGLGESTGRAMGYGWSGGRDVRAVTDWLLAQPGVDAARVGVLGLSMGGEQALTAAGSDERLRAVVAEGATERCYEDVRRTLGGVSLALGVPQYRALFGTCELLSGEEPPPALEPLVGRIGPRRALLLATEREAHYGERYEAASEGAVVLWAPSSVNHIGALAEHPREWEQRVISFFDGALAE